MKPLALPDDERAAKAKDGRLVVDSDGHEVLVGLTREESEWYIRDQETWFEQRQANKRSPADKRRSRELRERHEKARFEAMALMNAKPQGNA